MNRKYLLFIVVGIIFIGISSQAFALWPMGDKQAAPKNRRPEKMIERLAKELGLTAQQKDKYVAQEKKIDEERKAVDVTNKEIFNKIEEELLKDNPDRKVIFDHMQQISQNMNQIQLKRMGQIIDLRKELTPDQKIKLENIMKDMKQRRRGVEPPPPPKPE